MPTTPTKSDEQILDTLERDEWTEVFAKTAHEKFFQVHRGTTDSSTGDPVVIYGNDGFGSNSTSRSQVALLLRLLRHNHIEVLGFGVYADYSWALRVDSCDDESLDQAVWYCWFRATGHDHRFVESIVGKLRLNVPKGLMTKKLRS